MSRCSVCGKEVGEEEAIRCWECGKTYCPGCANRDPTIRELGVCPDCEETYEAEEDYEEWE